MSLRSMVWIGAIVAAGCGGQGTEPGAPAPIKDPTLDSIIRCPDPTACGNGNGTGVYYEEFGSCGMDQYRYMITHFTNTTSGTVNVVARYLTRPGGYWTYTPGQIMSALFNGVSYQVQSVHEYSSGGYTWATYPVFTLTANGVTQLVYGYQLSSLTLYVELGEPSTHIYALTFSAPTTGSGYDYELRQAYNNQYPNYDLYEWDVHYQEIYPTQGAVTPYCVRRNGSDDEMLFQEGIDVDPLTGIVTANANDVTFSARHGAPATSYYWGYSYQNDADQRVHFRSAIQMKRASYCGDANYHTIAGQELYMQDNIGEQPAAGHVAPLDAYVEAFWTPTGASCYDPAHPRLDPLQYQGWVTENGSPLVYDGTCNGTALPTCPNIAFSIALANAFGGSVLVDAPARLQGP